MSSDTWTICPKCQDRIYSDRQKKLDAVKKSYGKIASEKYISDYDDAVKPVEMENTLREDYEIGITDGVYTVSYGASCSRCDFRFSNNFEAVVSI